MATLKAKPSDDLAVASIILERLLCSLDPQRPRLLTLIAFELVGRPEQRAEDGGAIIAGQLDDARLDDEAAELDQMPVRLWRSSCQLRMSCRASAA